MVNLLQKMDIDIMENGTMVYKMAVELKYGKTEENTLENLETMNKTATEL